jgi:ABC-type Mn2+/Zn2+ transport system ATPase subunit
MAVMKLKNIKIENYRFFKEEQEFDFTSKDNIPQNILLYGENGSGKTSLYNALKDFFFYYKNQSESKTKIKENKNIFCEPTDKPKIEISFENDTNIKFSETGFENEDLKEKIEEVSKSKLFLTYQDIYNLNNMFKNDISYKEFKDIFTILYFDDLNHLFSEFEDNLKDFKNEIKDKDTLEENYNVIKRLIEEFDETFSYELDPIEKEDPIDKDVVPNVYDTVYYLDVNLLEELEGNKNNLVKFLDICEEIINIDSFDLIEKYDDIIENVSKYTKENDRYNKEEIITIDEVINEGNSYLDDFNTNILMHSSISESYIKCKELSSQINNKIYNNLQSSIIKINYILNFLKINIKIEKIIEKSFLKFNLKYITQKEDIKNIDFKILLSDIELKNHWSNLNEAKLSALNLAIYFSSVLGKKPNIPILVLDDLLISLDMSNRDKILSLLLDRSDDNKFFDDDYQMFIFTHDRAFFEKAKQNFEYKSKKKWKYFEMFVDLEENEKYQIPYIKKNEQNNMSKAEYHFKNKDYPACANYLRKEVENKFDRFLKLDNLDEKIKLAKLKENEHIIVDTAKDLKKLIDVLKQFEQLKDIPQNIQIEKCSLFSKQIIDTIKKVVRYIEEEFHFDEFEDIKLVLKNILHPQSHSDITKPLYKKELEEAIKLMEEFNNILRVQNEAIITRV